MRLTSSSKLVRFVTAAVLLLDVNAGPLRTQAPGYDESQIRAMILVNLAKFVEWPSQRSDPHLPFVICTVGNEPVGADLELLLEGKAVQGRAVLVRRGVDVKQADSCHILYIPQPKSQDARNFTADLANASVLTVSAGHQARSGVVVGLPLIDGRVQIEIDRSLAQRSTLLLSSQLLQIATGAK